MADDDPIALRRENMLLRLAIHDLLKHEHDRGGKPFDKALKRLDAAVLATQPYSPPFVRREALETLLVWLSDEHGEVMTKLYPPEGG